MEKGRGISNTSEDTLMIQKALPNNMQFNCKKYKVVHLDNKIPSASV